MSDLPTGEAIALGFALALALVVFAGLCLAGLAWRGIRGYPRTDEQ